MRFTIFDNALDNIVRLTYWKANNKLICKDYYKHNITKKYK